MSTKRTEQAIALLERAQELLEEAPFPTQTPLGDRPAELMNAGTHVGSVLGRLHALRGSIGSALVPFEVTGAEPYAKNHFEGRPRAVEVDEEGSIRYV